MNKLNFNAEHICLSAFESNVYISVAHIYSNEINTLKNSSTLNVKKITQMLPF
ncbi:hypothetical protein SJDPG2_07225 [Porphyromonas gingivalis SJD2]|nr:hypothetical protein SJDPG2_07225 [Porphyromonas gingivalis SJD2]OWR79424.1 hypothetical protein SJDPG5_03690 [Porphyromonas gingivalis SJD5]